MHPDFGSQLHHKNIINSQGGGRRQGVVLSQVTVNKIIVLGRLIYDPTKFSTRSMSFVLPVIPTAAIKPALEKGDIVSWDHWVHESDLTW